MSDMNSTNTIKAQKNKREANMKVNFDKWYMQTSWYIQIYKKFCKCLLKVHKQNM